MSSNFITAHLLRLPGMLGHLEEIPGGAAILSNSQVHSETVLYGSSAGPFGGIGCAAMTSFQMTLIKRGNLCVIFADERPFGWCDDHDLAATILQNYQHPRDLPLTRFTR